MELIRNSICNCITLIDFLIPPFLTFVRWVIGRLLCARVAADIKGTKGLTVYLKGARDVKASGVSICPLGRAKGLRKGKLITG